MCSVATRAREVVAESHHAEHLAVRDLARHWRVSPATVRKLIRCQHLRAHRVGRVLRVAPEEIARYESEQ